MNSFLWQFLRKVEPCQGHALIRRHPQTLLLPLQQYQRNVGYLLGQGLTQAEVLSIWKQRAGLLLEPLRKLHGEVLALRSSNRPLMVSLCHCFVPKHDSRLLCNRLFHWHAPLYMVQYSSR